MKRKTLRLLGFLNNFGLFKGLTLFIKMQFGFISKVKLPTIKHPISLRKDTSDFRTFLQVFIDREYKINFEKPKVVFDCGANIGLFAIQIKNEFPDVKIICIEPDPENFLALKDNLSGYDNIYFENCGIWNLDTKLKVYDKYNVGKWGIVVEEDLVNGTIPAVSIKTLMQKYGVEQIDILKLDIETSEKQLFSNNYEAWLPNVKTIVIEFHDFMLEGCSKTFFLAANKCINHYEFKAKGENIIIVNKDLN